ncbi:MAG TPA: VOC family protein [Candidatus Dormibacteraeota bacterium]|jgi:predicted 3-demethylubiquinone-9 3-methyltransferase (glyoxalase superfamily)|nr:VOC family protein [Candidatus Dormibacteraeota bacterium]HEX2680024.1 VOC family protein [Candidatus Dormibacteraeota bacterium]
MVRPCIVFVDRAEEAVNFYVSLIPNSKVLSITRSESDGPIPKGKVLNATFQIDGKEFLTFDGGPSFSFTEGFSLMITCKSQQEIDHYWSKLTADGGEEGPCGWCKDRFGLSWQVIPESLGSMLSDPKHGNNVAATQAMLKMKKLDIAALEKAYKGTPVA